MGNLVDTMEARIQNAISTAIDSINTLKTELAIRSKNASSGRDATSVMANSELGEQIGVTANFEKSSERNITLFVLNTNDENWNDIPGEVSEFSVPGTNYDRQTHSHHNSHRNKKIIY